MRSDICARLDVQCRMSPPADGQATPNVKVDKCSFDKSISAPHQSHPDASGDSDASRVNIVNYEVRERGIKNEIRHLFAFECPMSNVPACGRAGNSECQS